MAMESSIPRRLTAAWLKAMYRDGKLSPETVVRELVRRSREDGGNPVWITPPSLELAQPYLDRLGTLDKTKAPLWGIPFAIKDNIDWAGVPTTAACPAFAYTPEEHAAVVERLIEAGAIPLGKTNLDQFATGLVGTRSPYGETKNAFKEELISGGSSSGSAVAVALGHAAFSLGTDTAGSGRVPAALHGLVGYKPSIGAWPTKGVVPACASLDCVTVFAHTLDDALTVDAVVRGVRADDPWSRDIPAPRPQLPSKVILPKEKPVFFGPYAEAYEQAWQRAEQRLGRLGIAIERMDTGLFEEAAKVLYDGPWVAERWAALGDFVESRPSEVFPVTERILRSGSAGSRDAADVFKAVHRLQTLKLEAKKMLNGAVLAMPTAGGTYTRDQVREKPIETNSDMGKYTNHCNLLDLCAVAVPAGEAAPDVPFGITLFGLADQEGFVCGAAKRFVAGSAMQPPEGTTLVAVCGLHMRGYPLESQMIASGASFAEEAKTAPKYRLVKLPTDPAKPGLVKLSSGGVSVRLELWEMPLAGFGEFAASIPAPLGIGKIELEDGRAVPGFLCEAYAAEDAEDISALGGWHAWTNS